MGHKLSDNKFKKDIEDGKFRYEKLVTVTDDWIENYVDDKIRVAIFIMPPSYKGDKYLTRVVASGTKIYLVLDYESLSHSWAIRTFDHWKKYIYDRIPEGCNMEWFLEHGFLYN